MTCNCNNANNIHSHNLQRIITCDGAVKQDMVVWYNSIGGHLSLDEKLTVRGFQDCSKEQVKLLQWLRPTFSNWHCKNNFTKYLKFFNTIVSCTHKIFYSCQQVKRGRGAGTHKKVVQQRSRQQRHWGKLQLKLKQCIFKLKIWLQEAAILWTASNCTWKVVHWCWTLKPTCLHLRK